MISYDKLWNTMKKRGVTQYTLIKKYHISPGQITRLKRNESVSTHTIDTFCRILDCEVGDIMKLNETPDYPLGPVGLFWSNGRFVLLRWCLFGLR